MATTGDPFPFSIAPWSGNAQWSANVQWSDFVRRMAASSGDMDFTVPTHTLTIEDDLGPEPEWQPDPNTPYGAALIRARAAEEARGG